MGRPTTPGSVPWGDGAGAGRHRHSQFLVCHLADLAVLGATAVGLCRGVSGLDRGRWRQPAGGLQGAAAAGHCAGRGAGGGAGGAARGLCAHRAGQGAFTARRALGPCAAQRDDSDHPRDGAAVCQPAGRHHRGRERVLSAGPGAPDLSIDRQPRPDRGAQLRAAAGRDGGRRELRDRHALCADRPARQGQRHLMASHPAAAAVATAAAAPGGWLQRALRQRNFAIGAVLALLLIAAAALSLVWTPWSPYEMDLAAKLQPPTLRHWLGTDAFGRDVASLLLVGARNSILVGVIAVGIGLSVGCALGLLAAARRGWVEELIMRLADFGFAFPAILSAIMLTAVFGAGIVNSIIAIGIFNIPTFVRVTRASANALWSREYILAARACGKG